MGESRYSFECPYCEQSFMSPDGLKFHVGIEHPEKRKEFILTHYSAMEEMFRKQFRE